MITASNGLIPYHYLYRDFQIAYTRGTEMRMDTQEHIGMPMVIHQLMPMG